MKRKLDAMLSTSTSNKHFEKSSTHTTSPTNNGLESFAQLNLDAQIQQAIGKLKYTTPTLVQSKVIPFALEGRDIIVRSKTGSGKTAAYLIPIIQKLLEHSEKSLDQQTRVLILVPTKELADQVFKFVNDLIVYCAKSIRVVNISQNISEQVQQTLLASRPDIVISTPSRTITQLNANNLTLSNLQSLVVDEADLLFSYGYEGDLRALAKSLPSGVQCILVSATLSADVEALRDILKLDAILLELDQGGNDNVDKINQFYVICAEEEKFLLIYVILKLRLIKGKCLVFVSDIDRCYRLKLYLEQFGIRSCVLNSELPLNSRLHIVDEFNKNIYDIIIATDEHEVLGNEDSVAEHKIDSKTESSDIPPDKSNKKKGNRTAKRDREYGVSRGIDFQNVQCVINFDLPLSSKSYTHRIGRTARAGKSGMALSFVIPTALYGKHRPTSIPSTDKDEEVLSKIKKRQLKLGSEIKPYQFDMKQVEAFRYRMDDALRAVTKVAVKEARIKELRNELLSSDKLKRHFEENPSELQHLRHDQESRAARTQSHLKHVPEYLVPNGSNGIVQQHNFRLLTSKRQGKNRIRHARAINKAKAKNTKRKTDPLKSFSKSRS